MLRGQERPIAGNCDASAVRPQGKHRATMTSASKSQTKDGRARLAAIVVSSDDAIVAKTLAFVLSLRSALPLQSKAGGTIIETTVDHA